MLEIEEIRVHKENGNNAILREIASGEAHYISWAIPGLTYSSHFCKQGVKANADACKALFMEINNKNETGTLYPRAYMTFMPVEKANYYMETEAHYDGEYTEAEKKRHMNDALIANRDYIKAKKLYLDIRDLPNMDLMLMAMQYREYYSEMIRKIIEQEQMEIIDKLIIISG